MAKKSLRHSSVKQREQGIFRGLGRLPFVLSKKSVEYFLKLYYSERRRREQSLSKDQLKRMRGQHASTCVVLVGGLGGFSFAPQLETSLHEMIGGEVWNLGKGKREMIVQRPDGVWQCGSDEYRIRKWHNEVDLVFRRLIQIIEFSSQIQEAQRVVLIGHSSGGLINYVLGLLRKEGVENFLKKHRRHFPGVARISKKKLDSLYLFLRKRCYLVAVNSPFRGICEKLAKLGEKFIYPGILDALREKNLRELFQQTGYSPFDVIDLATHSEMHMGKMMRPTAFVSSALGTGLKLLSRIQRRGPNDGFVPTSSALLRENIPHHLRDLNLGKRDHRDVIEHVEVIYHILKRINLIESGSTREKNSSGYSEFFDEDFLEVKNVMSRMKKKVGSLHGVTLDGGRV